MIRKCASERTKGGCLVFFFPVAFSNEFVVNVCLDFSIAQYMEDSLLSERTKRILLIRVRKTKKKQPNKFTDKLECSINKKEKNKSYHNKDNSKKGTQKSLDKWYRIKVNTFCCYTNVSPSVELTLRYF